MLGTAPVAATIAVKDIDAAKKYYVDTLGLTIARDMAPNAFMCEAGRDSMILVYWRPNHVPGAATVATFQAATVATFQVGDCRNEVTDLASRGVKFEDYDMPGLKTEDHVAELSDGNKAA